MTRKLTAILLTLILMFTLSATALAAPGGSPPGGGSSNVSWSGATTITSSTTQSNQTYASASADQNALLINTSGTVTINNPTVTKSGGTSASDNYSFYGINSAVMCKGGGTTTITGGTITTSAAGANGVFSYGANNGTTNAVGDGTTVCISDTEITTTGNGSGGIMTTYGGTTVASNLTVTTSGGSSAPIRTDRGGGWVTVTGGTYTSSGLGSPAIYSTADVDVSDATLVSNKSEGVCIEGTGSIELTNCDLTATNNALNGNATFYDTVMIYQSMSGDASSGTSAFTMTGGTLTSNNGHVFHVTNTTATITLSGVTIVNNDSDGILLSVCDDGWSGGSNTATFVANGQTMEGTILVGSDSTLTLKLTDGTVYTGKISGKITNGKGTTVSTSVGTVSVTLDSTSKWYLTGDTYIKSFSGTAANVITNGYTLYVNGTALSGTSDSDDSGDDDTDEGYVVTFEADAGCSVAVYATQDVTGDSILTVAAGGSGADVSRSGSTGEPDSTGDGQVNFVVTVADGYAMDDVSATEGTYKNVKLISCDADSGVYVYRVTKITAATAVSVTTTVNNDGGDTENPFTDVTEDKYYYDAVLWAVENSVTLGTSATTFSPSADCTRGQIVTFLYRAAGSPDVSATSCDFTDVSSDAYYYKAVLWAVENGITVGTSATTFSPNKTCTRAETVTFLYRYAGSPAVTTASCDFTDVSSGAYYFNAVLWAVENGVTVGTSATTFSPSKTCSRAEIVTFLYRAVAQADDAGDDDDTGDDETGDTGDDTEGYAVQLTAPANAAIWVYNTQTVTGEADVVIASGTTGTVYARDTQGQIDVSGSGQVNFLVVPDDGWEVDAVTAAGSYKNLKGPDDTGTDNAYRVTKITAGDVVVTVTVKEASEDSGDETVTTGPTYFVFTDSDITVTGNTTNSYSVSGTALTISGAGTYSVSGSCADGSITVKKGTTGVTLILNGITLTSSDTAPIACNKSTAVTIQAAAGSVNTLTDSAYNNDDNYPDNANAENAVIKCKDGSQVTICGTGTINVIANGKNGVKGGATTDTEGTAWLTVKELTLNITANVNDGLKSDQELNVLSGNVTIKAADDGIKSDYVLNIGASGTTGPTINVTDSCEGIEAATMNVYSGDITVHASDDGMNAANSDLTDYSFALNIYGGSLYIDAQSGDGIDSNGTLTLAGGTVTVFSAANSDNVPLDCDGTLTLTGGTVLAVGSGGMAQTPNSASQAYLSFGAGGMGGPGGPGMNGFEDSTAAEGAADASLMGGPGGPGGPGDQGSISISAGDTIVIKDASGNVVYSATSIRAASYVFFTSAALTSGQTYTLYVNGASVATATATK